MKKIDSGMNTVFGSSWFDLMEALDDRQIESEFEASAHRASCRIEWPQRDHLRVRKVVKRSNARRTYKYPSVDVDRMVQCESELERDAFRLIDACPFVSLVSEQPAKVIVAAGGVELVYWPDALVDKGGRRIFVEFKHDTEAQDARLRERTAVVRAALARLGFGYCLLTERVIRAEPRFRNVRYLLRCGRHPVGDADRERIRRWFAYGGGRRTWSEVSTSSYDPVSRPQLCRLVLDGAVWLPLLEDWQADTALHAL